MGWGWWVFLGVIAAIAWWLWRASNGHVGALARGVASGISGRAPAPTAEAVRSYADAIDKERRWVLLALDDPRRPPEGVPDPTYRRVAGEALLAMQDGAARFEVRSTGRYRTHGFRVSIPIVAGVRYHIGDQRVRAQSALQQVDAGRLLVTDRAIVFEGAQGNERLTWGQVADVEILIDGFRISRRSGSPRIYAVQFPDPRFAGAIEAMLERTA